MTYTQRFHSAFRSVRDSSIHTLESLWARIQTFDQWALVGWVLGALLLATILLPVLLTIAVAAVVVSLVLGWLHEFVFLMGLRDQAFPGRHDKLIWIGLFVLMPPVGAVAFWMYRHACWPSSKPSPWEDDPDRLS